MAFKHHRTYKTLFRLFLIGLFFVSFISACLKGNLDQEEGGAPQGVVAKLNKNVEGLRKLAYSIMTVDSVAVFSMGYNYDGSVLYLLSMRRGENIELFSEIFSREIPVPELSMDWNEDDFYWTVNGVLLTDSEGACVSVTDSSKPVTFVLQDESIVCRVKNEIVGDFPVTRADYRAKDVFFDYDIDNVAFRFKLSSGFTTYLPTMSGFHLLDENVPNRSFYKDVFLDAGIGLVTRKSLAAIEYLGLSQEGIDFPRIDNKSKDLALQKAIIAGDPEDLNGRLLYPDGQPRYRLLFVNGGTSTDHGKSLGEEGLEAMRAFVTNGGSYVGTCAGAFFASNGSNGRRDYPYYLSVWPGMMKQSGLKDLYTGMFIEKASPLFHYFDLGNDDYVENVFHNLGGYPVKFPLKTEILARFDYQQNSSLHRKPSIWAYKESPQTGRVVMTGSHPEAYKEGECRDLTAAMILYALDGNGVVSIKGFLRNGEERVMDKKTSENNPAYTRIGDLQTHHFAAFIPSGARNIRVELNSSCDCDLALMMNQDSYAFADNAKYRSSFNGAKQKLSFPSLREGIWFIAVQCLTTVTAKETDYGQKYSGRTDVLNGIPYQIKISWE